MPVVQVYMWKGITQEHVNQIISGITNVFVEMGVPMQAVEVLVHEVPKAHWGIRGKPATEALPEEKGL